MTTSNELDPVKLYAILAGLLTKSNELCVLRLTTIPLSMVPDFGLTKGFDDIDAGPR